VYSLSAGSKPLVGEAAAAFLRPTSYIATYKLQYSGNKYNIAILMNKMALATQSGVIMHGTQSKRTFRRHTRRFIVDDDGDDDEDDDGVKENYFKSAPVFKTIDLLSSVSGH
jgi:dTDP-D-glucose 4,6-dehydratase